MSLSKQRKFVTGNTILCCIYFSCCLATRITNAGIIGCDGFAQKFRDEKTSCDVHETKFYNLIMSSRDRGWQSKSTKTVNSDASNKHSGILFDYLRRKCYQCDISFCDCSSLNLTEVPQNLSHSMKMLSLARNSISVLPKCSFCNYNQLTYLDMSSNKLTRLEIGSFWKLQNLEYLSLKNNRLIYNDSTFPRGVFTDLHAVTCLKLNRNTDLNRFYLHYYPKGFLSNFVNLETLYLDGLYHVHFDTSFKQLTKLRHLILAGGYEGYCKIVGLHGDTFENVAQITLLNISDCLITSEQAMNSSVFVPLVNLTNLDVSYNLDLGLNAFLESLRVVRMYHITQLRMNLIISRSMSSVTITRSMVQSLPPTLKYLEAIENNFESIERGILQDMPPELEYIDVGANSFRFQSYIQDIHLLHSLRVLKVNSNTGLFHIPKYQPDDPVTRSFLTDNEKNNNTLFEITLPPKLLCLEMRNIGMRYVISELTVNESNVLQSLSLEGNYFPYLLGPLKGLKLLKQFDLSRCLIKDINNIFFQYFENLKELNLKSNKIGNSLKTYNNRAFKNLTHLKLINLSDNGISHVGINIFQNLDNLEIIDFSLSEMRDFIINISNMQNLRLLNLSYSDISSLPLDARRHIDFLLTKHNMTVDLSYNPISCECSNLNFLRWMVNSAAFDSNFTNYMCNYEDSGYKYVHDSYQATLQYLNIRCADNSVIFLVVVAATLCMVTFVAAVVLYRFRWKIRYLYHAAYLVLRSKKKLDGEEENFRYDVFISYAYQDEQFIVDQILPELTKRDLKVLVHGRDFAVGEFIASNIVTAVKESRKTLVVLTRDLLRSTWCHFELQMANVESVHTGRSVLVFLIKETIPTKEMTSDLLKHVNNNTYIVYPQEETTPVFWDKLTKDLLLP